MTILPDDDGEARSLMNRAPCICDGEKTGHVCANFWSVIQKFDAANADTMRRGESNRACTLMDGWPLEFTSEEKPTYCTRYTPRKVPGLVALVERAVFGALGLGLSPGRKAGTETVRRGGPPLGDRTFGPDPELNVRGYVPYDRYFNDWQPMTQAEIAELRAKFPDTLSNMRGKNIAFMTAADIASAEPIGMAKPGEAPPTVSQDTEDLVDGLFGKDMFPTNKD